MLDLSIILPALSINADFLRCLHSIRASINKNIKVQIICVVPSKKDFLDFESEDLLVTEEEYPSIYGAMNTGIKKSTGRYLYFIGQDDILLPSASEALLYGRDRGAHLILADVFWGRGAIYRNKVSRNTLIWRNWCHQGIFYDRQKFIEHIGGYPLSYKVQADHYCNIVFTSHAEIMVVKFDRCVAWYSATGNSSHIFDLEFRNAFPNIIKKYFGFTRYIIVVTRRLFLIIAQRIINKK